MITAISERERYRVRFGDGRHQGVADAAAADGGGETGFKPDALIEAALAACIAMTVRMWAERKGLRLPGLETRVKLDRSRPGAPVLRYDVDLGDAMLSEQERATLRHVAEACPVHKLLSRPVNIERSELFL